MAFGSPSGLGFHELTVPVQVEIDLDISWEVWLVGDPVIPLGGWGGPATSIRPRSESILFSRMVLDLRTLSANLTSPNHNNIHSHVVSHDLFQSDDVGRRWLSTCLLFHIIFLTTLIASPLFLQCLVSYHRSEIYRLNVLLSPLQDPLSRHHLIITIRWWSAYKLS